MLDARFIKENADAVKEALKKRNYEFPLSDFLAIEEKRMAVMREVEELRNRRNVVSEEIGRLKRQKEDASAQLEEMKTVAEKIKSLDDRLRAVEEETRALILTIPNIPHESVPVGRDENENVEVRKWGSPRQFDFEPLNHWDIAEALDIIDFDRASKISGARFALMKGAGARLERSLMNLMLDTNTSKGYKEVFPPIIVNRESMTGT
ncbi:MAG: serine--tRNA ligase, partial [Nitrospiraceae bacterium]|nr:serine--tRNA ligase [Nitrospiraceae bacterium]